MNSKGDMIIEYSYNQYRLFYGLKKNGKYYFPEIIKEIEIKSDSIDSTLLNRYESVNSFVSLVNDFNKEKEYLLSISSYKTILELHDFENNIYEIAKAENFFHSSEGIFSYIFPFLELKNVNKENFYFCIFTIRDYSDIFIKRLTFPHFNFEINDNNYTTIHTYTNRIICAIYIDYYHILAIFFLYGDHYAANLYYYDNYNLNEIYECRTIAELRHQIAGDGIFYKACYLYSGFFAFLYFEGDNSEEFFIFKVFDLNENYNFNQIKELRSVYRFSPIITMNEFLKIDNSRLVLLTTRSNFQYLYIIFFDLYNNFNNINTRIYFYTLYNEKTFCFSKEIAAFIYNDFLVFTGTLTLGTDSEYYPILLMFGYPNGTDLEVDISPYLIDNDNYNISNNLYNYLMATMKIDNNIYGYEIVEQIKLISIPDEIIFLNGTDNSQIFNNNTIDVNYALKQNEDITKNNTYYYLDYQFIVKEPDYDIFYSDVYCVYSGGDYLKNLYNPRHFYGRTNTLKFKLCHKYCKTCKRMGISNVDQKCESCLDDYSYFNGNENTNNICIPEGYFYDSERGIIENCTFENSKFYINISNGKTICFDDRNGCPINYQNYNENTKECKYSSIVYNTTLETSLNRMDVGTIGQIEISTQIGSNDFLILNSSSSYIDTIDKNQEINKMIDNELLWNYTLGDDSMEIKGENNTIFQLTTTGNELERFLGNLPNNNSLSIIDLGNCETILKDHYGINQNMSLIIKKHEKITISSERNVQYQVYHPITKEKLNLSLCDSEKIDLYIPVKLDEKSLSLYEDLQNSGYDLFNINDPFYNDLCSPYKSENSTDVLLSDRKKDYYNDTFTSCQSNCEYSSFNSKYQFLKCECKIIIDDIDINNFNELSEKIYENFYDILKNSNYKAMKCYKLVFNIKFLKKNIGNFIVLIFFLFYLCCLIIYIIKGISPLKEEIIKTLNIKFKNIDVDNSGKIISNKKNNLKNNKKEKIIESPPIKRKSKVIEGKNKINPDNKTKKVVNKYKKIRTDNNINSDVLLKIDKKININNNEKNINIISDNLKVKKKRKTKFQFVINQDDIVNNHYNKKEIYDDLDLNNLNYEEAIKFDKRTFIQIYLSKLKNNHLILFTFFSCNDHNLINIKISRFLFLICTNLAMNVVFFFDSSMHKIYLDYGKYNFIQQIPQIIYSSLISLIIGILISILIHTDINIYEIRQLKKFSSKKVNKILKLIKIKLIIYFIISFILFLFYWYFVSAFCGVYTNTQIIFIKDSSTSFCLGLLYPFLIQLFFTLIRLYSLRGKSKCKNLLYKFS